VAGVSSRQRYGRWSCQPIRTWATSIRRVNEGQVKQGNHVGSAIAYNFLPCARDQGVLLPPDLGGWLPADHLAWFVLDVVDQLDLGPFLSSYRADGHGRAAYDPRMLLGVLLYAYCTGIRSCRQIERRCHEDIAVRVLSGNSAPDHVTIARFRVRHEQALAGLLVQSLRLCAAAGMVGLGTAALDGTKLAANAAARRNRTSGERQTRIKAEVRRMLEQASQTDQREDQDQAHTAGSQVLPAELASRGGGWPGCARQGPPGRRGRRLRTHPHRAGRSHHRRGHGRRPATQASYRHRPRDEAPRPDATANTTDPDSRRIHNRHGSRLLVDRQPDHHPQRTGTVDRAG
jgi:transposase